MTEKELLYIDDALSQTKLFQTKCANYSDRMQERELKSFVKELEGRQEALFTRFFRVLQ